MYLLQTRCVVFAVVCTRAEFGGGVTWGVSHLVVLKKPHVRSGIELGSTTC